MHISACKVHGDLEFYYIYQEYLKIGLHFLRDLFQKVSQQFLSRRIVSETLSVPTVLKFFGVFQKIKFFKSFLPLFCESPTSLSQIYESFENNRGGLL